ncbi:unnamed protein product [Schistosoma curassoni]|nr:unnamed protein product [Schistosoma curassoni]
MWKPSDIPGYYYDHTKKRYFKIENHGTPGFVTQKVVDTYFANSEIQRKVDQMLSIRRRKFLNILQLLNRRETSNSLSVDAVYTWPHCYIRNKKCKQTIPVKGQIRNALVYSNNNSLYTISSNSLTMFTFNWGVCESVDKNSMRFELSETSKILPTQLGCFRFIDISWYVPGKELALLTESASGGSLITLKIAGENHALTSQLSVPFNPSLFRFCTSYLTPTATGNLHNSRSVNIMTRNEICISNYNYCIPLYVSNTYNQLSRRRNKVIFTACCEASIWKSFNPVKKCIKSVNGRQPLMYVAGVSDSKGFLSLVEPSLTPHKNIQLINYHTGYWTTLAQRIPTNTNLEVTSLQCFGTSSGDRLGLIVGRRCGLIELWDDRFPNKPVIEYYGSDGSTLMSVSSHIPPCPVIDPVLQTTIASPLLPNHHIGIWDLHKGDVINVYELSHRLSQSVSCAPPIIIHRTSWNNQYGLVCKGPALLALDDDYVYCFN